MAPTTLPRSFTVLEAGHFGKLPQQVSDLLDFGVAIAKAMWRDLEPLVTLA